MSTNQQPNPRNVETPAGSQSTNGPGSPAETKASSSNSPAIATRAKPDNNASGKAKGAKAGSKSKAGAKPKTQAKSAAVARKAKSSGSKAKAAMGNADTVKTSKESATKPLQAPGSVAEAAGVPLQWFENFAGANLEVLVATSIAATRAGQELQNQMTEFFLRNSEQTARRIRLMADCRNADDLILMQSDWSNSLIEDGFNDLSKLTDSGFRLIDEIIDPLAKQLTETAERLPK